jgi:hypothetical protein
MLEVVSYQNLCGIPGFTRCTMRANATAARKVRCPDPTGSFASRPEDDGHWVQRFLVVEFVGEVV